MPETPWQLCWFCFENYFLAYLPLPLTSAYSYGTLKSLGQVALLWPAIGAFGGMWLALLLDYALGRWLAYRVMQCKGTPAAQRMLALPTVVRWLSPLLSAALLLPLGGVPLVVLVGFLRGYATVTLPLLTALCLYTLFA